MPISLKIELHQLILLANKLTAQIDKKNGQAYLKKRAKDFQQYKRKYIRTENIHYLWLKK